MKKHIAVAAFAAAAAGGMADVAVAEPKAVRALDVAGVEIDFAAAAKAEGMATPTKNFRISARYGQAGAMWSSGRHTGLDFAAAEGTTIMSSASGRIVAAEPAGAYGNMIEIAHGDGVRTRYAHLSDIDVAKGQRVARGQHIGNLGNTGNSSGPHLHFEVLVDGKNVDPEKHL